MSHTPGPWSYERIGSGEFLITDPGPPLPGFKVSAVGKMGLNEDDARVAAAAPDLLASLLEIRELEGRGVRHTKMLPCERCEAFIRANAAIAKAGLR